MLRPAGDLARLIAGQLQVISTLYIFCLYVWHEGCRLHGHNHHSVCLQRQLAIGKQSVKSARTKPRAFCKLDHLIPSVRPT